MFFKLVAFAAIAAQLVAGTAVVERDAEVTHTGRVTFFHPGLGACGETNTDSDFIVALGHAEFDSGSFCGRRLTATFQGKSVTVTVVDRCAGCGQFDLDLSPAAFEQLADLDVGVLNNVQWHFLA